MVVQCSFKAHILLVLGVVNLFLSNAANQEVPY